ncbi:3-oxoacyl-(acyl-carrier-protein) reductase [Desulfofarcimen acetoxidans DSM 771]|uniref:3-oxoacyl-[acyl-carrier-protein] reductase n=1 Tax=Desulfofarcimen acetoxidans (strain ATCC 49208 / DSM 771 / KCTC 5769 / VKM B-1644 / 5575) TaxID=485916 RepID=C8W583_DESAS|nr:3-oxoacyl-[acyl-carrier-protein] reductase [Desulfofarcimen acetoxidans]ACV62065.1 3-oxoacyl-(acyl-carrier-protein) reductase [Desulfofarcimen acetoxidans DSM 771]
MLLESRVALVTGASRGIGRAVALALAGAGSDVAINCAGRIEAAEEVAGEIRSIGRRALVVKANVADPAEVNEMVKTVLSELGRLDILVNNAGITRDNLVMRMSEDDWDSVISVNLKGSFNCAKAVTRSMLKARYGRIVNISSVVGISGNAGQANYASSKAGLIGFSKTLAKELGSRNITVNVVAPGFIETDMTSAMPDDLKKSMSDKISLGRLGKPEDVAAAVVFLVSEQASYITGQVLAVDGGLVI